MTAARVGNDEIRLLQGWLNDLDALMAPAPWSGHEPFDIVGALLDAVVGMLRLEFAYARLGALPGEAHERTIRSGRASRRDARDAIARDFAQRWRDGEAPTGRAKSPDPFGGGELSLALLALGPGHELGVVVAASKRADFPTRIEALLLRIACDRVAIGLQETRRRSEQIALGALARAREDLAHMARITTMGELTASIAHEVNQPLAAIVTNATACVHWLAAAPPNTGEARSAAQRIIRDANRAGDVIAHIRAFVMRGEPQRRAVRIAEVISDVVDLVTGEARAQSVAIDVSTMEDIAFVMADRVQLQQVLLNLVVNAIEAMSATNGRPRAIHIGVHFHNEHEIRVSVRDTGPGLASMEAERVFDMFYTTKPQGMGMGLAISRSIIESHGGRLWATPNEAGGETFQFTLPIDEAMA